MMIMSVIGESFLALLLLFLIASIPTTSSENGVSSRSSIAPPGYSNFLNSHQSNCMYEMPKKQKVEVYFINMDKSADRKVNMERHLGAMGYRHKRIRGLTPQEIYIPADIEKTWRTAWCQLNTEFVPPSREEVRVQGPSHPFYNYSAITTALCGRGKNKNTPKELGCTTSHLLAMREAIYSPTATSRYALIIEDDVLFPFDIDIEAMAKTAPAGFGILQLFNSNKESLGLSWTRYTNNNGELWLHSKNLKFWSTCAYLIDREVMKPVIDAVVDINKDGYINFKVVAGIEGPCSPPECCDANKKFIEKPPCVWASFGYQADSFLYSMTQTYMSTVPLIVNGRGVNSSTFHQEHVEMFHKASFRKLRRIVNEMLTGKVPPPAFAKAACQGPIPEIEN